ncbi:MAG: DUF262 domain-containing protein [Verrucomicrobiota bacterium]
MSYQKCTIRQALADIDQNKVFLPALQRKFVWGKPQIELLFDSMMRNYPFGTFLFWRLRRQKADSYVFYEFLTDYDSRTPYNRRHTGAFLHPEIIGVLDGQQRLSSMYLGLMGTHREKIPYKRGSSDDDFPKMCLYLNLLSLPYTLDANDKIQLSEEENFEFRFLKPDTAGSTVERRVHGGNGDKERTEPVFWMKVGQVLSWDDEPEFGRVIDQFRDGCASERQRTAFTVQRRMIERGLRTLHDRIHRDELINYFEVAKDDLEDILKIFVRVNSGGSILSKTDLLFSTIVATWNDGREEIEKLMKAINEKGDGFNFTNEYLMRCCLVLSDGPVIYKVNSFKAENVQKIRDEWPRIAEAIIKTVDLLTSFGFSGPVLTSQNATIILAYYIHKGGSLDAESKVGMRKYLIHALLNTIYGSAQEQLISTLRGAFRAEVVEESGKVTYRGTRPKFLFDELLEIELPQQKRLAITEDDLERFLSHSKGPGAFLVLTLLYPHLRYSEVTFHQDHIHPFSGFTKERFAEVGIPEAEWQDWWDMRDRIPNLQLLKDLQNISKNATPLKEWLANLSPSELRNFIENNYFPEGVGFDFKDFRVFYTQRKELLRRELRKILAMTNAPSLATPSSFAPNEQEEEPRPNRPPAAVCE